MLRIACFDFEEEIGINKWRILCGIAEDSDGIAGQGVVQLVDNPFGSDLGKSDVDTSKDVSD